MRFTIKLPGHILSSRKRREKYVSKVAAESEKGGGTRQDMIKLRLKTITELSRADVRYDGFYIYIIPWIRHVRNAENCQ